MESLEAIHTRRSIRSYQSRPVNDALLKEVIAAGMAAPSAGNEQPWQFLVIRSHATLGKISAFGAYAEMAKNAPAAILVCADMEKVKHPDYWLQDCAAATENMLLAAHSMGLGSVWVGVHPREKRVHEFQSIVHLPEHIVPFSFLPIGFPAEEKEKVERFDQTRIHYEQW
jgi:nitroreductase